MTSRKPLLQATAASVVLTALVAAHSAPLAKAAADEERSAPPPPAAAPQAVTEADEPDDNPYDSPAQPVRPAARPARVAYEIRDGMVHVPGGTFTMGTSSRTAPQNERPAHQVTVPSFWLDRIEVTVQSYRACVEAGLCSAPRQTAATCTYTMGDPNLPISCVRWADADRYCQAEQKRLPTEVEWEFAARGASRLRYPWGGGNSNCAYATTLISDTSGRSCAQHPSPAESKPQGASPFGILNMTGNVEEWTADWYTESPGGGPSPRIGTSHVLRGGGWLSPPSMSTTTSRDWGSAVEAGPNTGFRCAKDGS